MKIKFIFVLFGMASLLLTPLAPSAWAAGSETVAVADGIKSITNIPYILGAGSSQQLDLYLPEIPSGTPPLIIIIHGGGWSGGDKGDFAEQCKGFVKRGYAAASLNYRFSNQAIFPAQVIDCKAAVRWLRAKSTTYHFDPKRFVVGGHSAGGHLAAFLGVTDGLQAFDAGTDLGVSSNVQAVIWLAGVGDLLTLVQMPGYESEQPPGSPASQLIGGAVLQNVTQAERASPMTYVSSKAAPFLFFHGDSDTIVPFAQAAEMYGALTACKVPCELHPLLKGDHGTPSILTPEIYTQIDSFLSHVLKWSLPQTPPHP